LREQPVQAVPAWIATALRASRRRGLSPRDDGAHGSGQRAAAAMVGKGWV